MCVATFNISLKLSSHNLIAIIAISARSAAGPTPPAITETSLQFAWLSSP